MVLFLSMSQKEEPKKVEENVNSALVVLSDANFDEKTKEGKWLVKLYVHTHTHTHTTVFTYISFLAGTIGMQSFYLRA